MSNKALTLEELRKMDGEPVWIHTFSRKNKVTNIEQWALVASSSEYSVSFVRVAISGRMEKKCEDYGKTWLVYAYEPTRIDRSEWESCAYCGYYSGKCCANCCNGGNQAYQEPCKSCYCASKWEPKENFCPYCGRPLHDASWDMLERRMHGD